MGDCAYLPATWVHNVYAQNRGWSENKIYYKVPLLEHRVYLPRVNFSSAGQE